MSSDQQSPARQPTTPVSLSDTDELEAFITEQSVALVEFYTDGCGICASMEPVLGVVAETSDAAVGMINPRDDPPLIDRFEVQSVPLLVLFNDGSPVARRAEGFVGADEIVDWIDQSIANA